MDINEVPQTTSTLAAQRNYGFFGCFNFKNYENVKSSLLRNWSNKSTVDQELAMEDGRCLHAHCSFPPLVTLARMVGAEFIGTFMLIFAGTATSIVNQEIHGSESLLGLAASCGLAIMIVILSAGHISGAHVNPAVTITFAALKHFPWKQVPAYIAAQFAGSLCAAVVLKVIFHPYMNGGVTVPSGGCAQAFALEFIISFNLLFVITAVSTDTRAVGELAGLAVGATVMVNVLIAGETTGASMNPARTLGPAIAAGNFRGIWVYLIAPVIGGLCGAGAYTVVKLPKNSDDSQEKSSIGRSYSIGRSFRR